MPALPTPKDGVDIPDPCEGMREDIKAFIAKIKEAMQKDFGKSIDHEWFIEFKRLQNKYSRLPDAEPFLSYKNILKRLSLYMTELPATWNDYRRVKKKPTAKAYQDILGDLDDMNAALGNDVVAPEVEKEFPVLRDMHAKIESLRVRVQTLLANVEPMPEVTLPAPHEEHADDNTPTTATVDELRDVRSQIVGDQLHEQERLLILAKDSHPDNLSAHLMAIQYALQHTKEDPLARFVQSESERLATEHQEVIKRIALLRQELESMFE